MDTESRKPSRFIPKERKAELKRLERLPLILAAEYLEMTPKTLRNRLSLMRRDPNRYPDYGPEGDLRRDGTWEFRVIELDAWDRRQVGNRRGSKGP
jgi:hypothetical protein